MKLLETIGMIIGSLIALIIMGAVLAVVASGFAVYIVGGLVVIALVWLWCVCGTAGWKLREWNRNRLNEVERARVNVLVTQYKREIETTYQSERKVMRAVQKRVKR